jgi:outer membrane protein assembly factor BamB
MIEKPSIFVAFLAMLCVFAQGTAAQGGTAQQAGDDVKAERPYAKCWEFSFEKALATAPATDNGTVFLAEPGGVLRAVESVSGETLWSVELGGSIVSDILLAHGRLFVATNPSNGPEDVTTFSTIRSINPESGITDNIATMPFSSRIWLGRTVGGAIAVTTSGIVLSFDAGLTGVNWENRLGGELTADPYIDADRVVIALRGGHVVSLNIDDGLRDNKFAGKHDVTAVSLTEDGAIIAGDKRGNIVSISGERPSARWSLKIGGSVTEIAWAGADAAVSSLDNFVYMVSAESGNVIWRRRMAGRVVYRPLVLADKIIVPTYGEDEVTVLDRRSGRIMNKIQLGEGSYPMQPPLITRAGWLTFSVPGAIAAFSDSGCVAK